MSTPVAEAIEDVRNRLQPVNREHLNQLAGAINPTATSLELTYTPRHLALGRTIAIGTEDLVVMDNPSGRTVTVARGQHGTIAQDHALGDYLDERPRYSRGRVLRALRQEIASWPPELYRVAGMVLSVRADLRSYDLGLADATQLIEVLKVTYDGGDSIRLGYRQVNFNLQRVGNFALSPAADAVITLDWTPPRATDLWVEYATPFDLTVFTADTELVGGGGTVGLIDSMVEPAVLGAAWRLLQEAPRTDLEDQPTRAADEVAAGLITSVRRDLHDEYKLRIQEERIRLLRRYGYR